MTSRVAGWTLGGLLVASALALATVRVQDTDAWTHLALGRQIVEGRGFPSHEQFDFPSLEMPYYAPEWLFEVVLFLTWVAAGFPGVVLLKATIVGLAFFVLLRHALLPRGAPPHRALGAVVAVAVLFPFGLMLRHRFVERPDLVLMVFLGFTVYALDAYVWEGKRYLYLLPALQIVWVNMHPSIVAGVVPFLAVLVGGQLQGIVRARWGVEVPGTPTARQLRVVLVVFVLVLLASLLNPYGVEPFVTPFRLATSPWLRHEIVELQPPRWHEYGAPFVVVALLALAFLATVRHLSLISVLLVTPFVYLALSARRFVVVLAVVSAPLLARYGRALATRLGGSWLPRSALPAGLVVALAVVTVTGLTFARVEPFVDPDQVPGLGVNEAPLPEGALRYLDRVGLGGRVFNTFHWGGYIVWRDFPRRAPFVDGRGYLPAGLLDEMLAARGAPSRLARLQQRYGFDVAVLDYPRDWSPMRDDTPNIDFGLTSPDWALVYWDDVALVYVRRTAALAALIDHDEYRAVKPANGPLALRQRLGDAERLAAVERELARNLAETGSSIALTLGGFVQNEIGAHRKAIELLSRVPEFPPSPYLATAYRGLAFAHARLGETDPAIAYYRKALRFDEDPLVFYSLGVALARTGRDREAVRALERALELDRRVAPVYPALIAAYRRVGDLARAQRLEAEYPAVLAYGQAEEHFRKGLRLYFERRYAEAIAEFRTSIEVNPRSPHARSNLGWVYFDLGLLDQALAEQKAALDVDPAFANAHYGLGLIHRRRGEPARARAHFEEYLRLEPSGYWSRRASEEISSLSAR